MGVEPEKLSPPHYYCTTPICHVIATTLAIQFIFCKYLDFPKLCILPSTGSVLSCRPEVWARREAEKIVAARDAAYAEAVAKGEPIDEGEDIGDFKPSDMKRIL